MTMICRKRWMWESEEARKRWECNRKTMDKRLVIVLLMILLVVSGGRARIFKSGCQFSFIQMDEHGYR